MRGTWSQKFVLAYVNRKGFCRLSELYEKMPARTAQRVTSKLVSMGLLLRVRGFVASPRSEDLCAREALLTSDVERILGVSARTILSWQKAKLLPPYRSPGYRWMTRGELLEALNEARIGEPTDDLPARLVSRRDVLTRKLFSIMALKTWVKRGLAYYQFRQKIMFSEEELDDFLKRYADRPNPGHRAKAIADRLKAHSCQ